MSEKHNAAKLFGRKPRKATTAHASVPWKLPDQSVGLELEIESTKGSKWPTNTWPFWNEARDGSLRNGKEYVLAMPLKGDALSKAIHDLFQDGNWVRTTTGSTHIHLDMMEEDTTVDAIKVLTLMVYSLEDAVFRYINAGRELSGYTNKLSGAPDKLVASILNSTEDDGYKQLASVTYNDDEVGRYYGLNIMALRKYGSIEFRYFPTATTKEEMIEWVQMMMSFKKAALEIGTVDGLLEVFGSEEGYQRFMTTYFSEWADKFIAAVPYYRAISMVKKALATAESNKTANIPETLYTFAPQAITGNPALSRFVATPSNTVTTYPYNMLFVPFNTPAPPASLSTDDTIMVYQGQLYVKQHQDWIPLGDLTYEATEERQRWALYALETEQPTFTQARLRSEFGYNNAHAQYGLTRLLQGINNLRSSLGLELVDDDTGRGDDSRYPRERVRWRVDYNDRVLEEALRGNEDPEDDDSGDEVWQEEALAVLEQDHILDAYQVAQVAQQLLRPRAARANATREVPMPEPTAPTRPRYWDVGRAALFNTNTDSDGEF